jgi:hypothetical protein
MVVLVETSAIGCFVPSISEAVPAKTLRREKAGREISQRSHIPERSSLKRGQASPAGEGRSSPSKATGA